MTYLSSFNLNWPLFQTLSCDSCSEYAFENRIQLTARVLNYCGPLDMPMHNTGASALYIWPRGRMR